ncbi:hypothetical protein EPUS_07864 [Endocarpon pusillum Z07020]|uniref:MAGE domain-containing protein n=1 Tax=Endocarpon pusillum (strain Z07020 / HMAS-L-300199) TaxID=1263415 RepID=U1G042_ENDPU|nr:uncharacterized protein EPUS_07864 [Endocarpon pusillum Z07020]ERF70567.1 hypothetical protein EPUS_07864 [Endocarpon pusillum Z07020]
MAPNSRKRRSEQRNDPESSASESPARRRRVQQDGDEEAGSTASEPETQTQTQTATGVETMMKKLVRLALSCEYSRIPIRRADISTKVLGETGTRQFKVVFERAQHELRTKFGMQMEELPSKEKFTISQRRAAQASQKVPSTSSKSWILTSTLPPEYKFDPDILPPTKAPSESTEAIYTALYSFIIALILLNNGSLPENKLERYLKRANADQWTPILSTEKLLQKLVKEGYLEKRRDTSSGEEIIEWVVGPRGKIEVGERGVQGFVRAVYGGSGEEDEELERKLERSLGLQPQQRVVVDEGTEETPQVNGSAERSRTTRGRARPSARDDTDDE